MKQRIRFLRAPLAIILSVLLLIQVVLVNAMFVSADSVTALKAADFADTPYLNISDSRTDLVFANGQAYEQQFCPQVDAQVSVDPTKTPYFHVQTKSTDVPYCVGIKVGEGDVNWLIGDAYTGFNDTIDRYYSLSEAGVTAAGSVTVSFRWMTWGPEYPCNTANKKKVVFSYLGFAVDKPTTTALQAADFEIESLAPAVNFGEKGVKFTNGMIYQNQFCPTNAATVTVDTDKHPYVYVKTNAIEVPYAVGLSVKGGEPVWFLGDANNGTTAATNTYFAIKDLVSVSGKAELTLTFRWMT